MTLQRILYKIKILKASVVACAACKRVRDEQGNWQEIDKHIYEYLGAEFSHGICPQCMQELYPEIFARLQEKKLSKRQLSKSDRA